MLRSLSLRLAATAFGALSLASLPALAQGKAPSTPAKPATMELMNDLALTAAVSSCELAIDFKVPLQSSTIASAKAMSFLVSNRYGGQIGNTNKLEAEQIANGALIQTVGRIKQGCYTKLNATDKKFVDEIIADFEKQVKSQKK